MAEESNGHADASRLDRIERAIETLIGGHEGLLASQKQLLTAQVVMADTMTELGKRVEQLIDKVDAHEDRMQALIDSQLRVDATLEHIKKLLDRLPPRRP